MTQTFKKGDRVTAGANHGGAWTDMIYEEAVGTTHLARRVSDGVQGGFGWTELRLIEEAKLDLSKPLELSNGTPVVLIRKTARYSPTYCEVRRTTHRDEVHQFNVITGKHRYGRFPDLRNRKETPVASTLDLNKPLQTRAGNSAKFVTTAPDGRLIFEISRAWNPAELVFRYSGGRASAVRDRQDPEDIINKVEPLVKFWRNIYSDGSSGKTPHKSYESARDYCTVGKTRVGILEITTRGGEFVSSSYTAAVPYTRKSSLDTYGAAPA